MSITRWLYVPGAYNVRDLGGYPTKDGNTTRWQTFIRADSLDNLNEWATNRLVAYGVRTAVDLRSTQETIDAPNAFVSVEGVECYHVNIIGDTDPPGFDELRSGKLSTAEWTSRLYRVLIDRRQEAICEALARLARVAGHTSIFHCETGTDRTGIIAALLLGLVGVPEKTITEDYVLSAIGVRRRFLFEGTPEYLIGKDLNHPMRLAPRVAMENTLLYLRDQYGGIQPYVEHIGLTARQIAHIRSVLLE